MSHDLYTYGEQKAIYFKTTLSGDAVPGLTFEAADVQLSIDGAAFVNIGLACAEIALGIYKWTPASTLDTQGEVLIINIKDSAGGPLFDENCLILTTGGNVSARFNG